MTVSFMLSEFQARQSADHEERVHNPFDGKFFSYQPNEDDDAVYLKFPDEIVSVPEDKSLIEEMSPLQRAKVNEMMIFKAQMEYAKRLGKNVVMTFPSAHGGELMPSFDTYFELMDLRETLEAQGKVLATHCDNPRPGQKGLVASAAVHNFLSGSIGHRTMAEDADMLVHGVHSAISMYLPAPLLEHMRRAGHIDDSLEKGSEIARQQQQMMIDMISMEIMRGRYRSLTALQIAYAEDKEGVDEQFTEVKATIAQHIEDKQNAQIALYDAEMEKPEEERFGSEFTRQLREIDRPMTAAEAKEMGLVDEVVPSDTGLTNIVKRLPGVMMTEAKAFAGKIIPGMGGTQPTFRLAA